jgi:hypothetical protein
MKGWEMKRWEMKGCEMKEAYWSVWNFQEK